MVNWEDTRHLFLVIIFVCIRLLLSGMDVCFCLFLFLLVLVLVLICLCLILIGIDARFCLLVFRVVQPRLRPTVLEAPPL